MVRPARARGNEGSRRQRKIPPGLLRSTELVENLDQFEETQAAELPHNLSTLYGLVDSALYWSNNNHQPAPLRRLARFVRGAGDDATAVMLLRAAAAISPKDRSTAKQLCETLEGSGRPWEALQAIAHLLEIPELESGILATAARLYRLVGDIERSLQLIDKIPGGKTEHLGELLRILTDSGKKQRAIAEADRILEEYSTDGALVFSAFTVYAKLASDLGKKDRARILLAGCPGDWSVRASKLESQLDMSFARPEADAESLSWEGLQPGSDTDPSRSDLVGSIENLEKRSADSAAMRAEIIELENRVRREGAASGKSQLSRRLANLLEKAGDSAAAIRLLKFALKVAPHDQKTALILCNSLCNSEQYWEALQTVSPFACQPNATVPLLAAAARLYERVGDAARSLELFARAAVIDPRRRPDLLDMLVRSGRREEAIAETDKFLEMEPQNTRLCFACFSAYLKLEADESKVRKARDRLFALAATDSEGPTWRARALRMEGAAEQALAELGQPPASGFERPAVLRERASIALALGYWGRDAGCLLAARSEGAGGAALLENIGYADDFLRARGTSLEEAAKNPSRFAHLKSPETAFEMIASRLPVAKADRGTGLVMVVPSLAGGGAERIVAHCVNGIGRDTRFAWRQLYAQDLSRETGADFYLRYTGLNRSDITLLRNEETLESPWSWLGPGFGRRTQAIYARLKEDRPGILHASLDFVNITAGLAALAAGVPRIFLHTHNMRPTELGAQGDVLRHCYRVLLRRPEVSLVGCAHACIEDYAKWLDLRDPSRLHVVHNGMQVRRIIESSTSKIRAAQRSAHGIPRAALVIGTAFRFVELKQPFLWVDAAAAVLSRRPRCTFVMMDDGELHEAVREYIRGKGLSDRFILPGRVEDIYERMAMLDLFVLSSRTEALPNTLLEAQAAGVPVVAFDVGGIAETMMEGTTGWLVRENTAEALAERISATLEAREWLANASAAARRFVRTEFGNRRMIEKLTAILLGT
jgi:glycosyltransferase involved in cell wall biosynthesis/tetratricopeptide (TPR) repeat protein